MKTLSKTLAVLGLSACIAGASFYAYAESDNDALAVNNATINLSKALSTALDTVAGKASKIEFSNDDNNKAVWEVEVIDANLQVHDIEIDANTGAVIKNKLDEHDSDRDDDERDDD